MIMLRAGAKYCNISTQRRIWASLPQAILFSAAEVQKTLVTQASGFAMDVVHLSAFPPCPSLWVAYEGSSYWILSRK